MFRMVERAHGLPDDWQARAARLGAEQVASISALNDGTRFGPDPETFNQA